MTVGAASGESFGADEDRAAWLSPLTLNWREDVYFLIMATHGVFLKSKKRANIGHFQKSGEANGRAPGCTRPASVYFLIMATHGVFLKSKKRANIGHFQKSGEANGRAPGCTRPASDFLW